MAGIHGRFTRVVAEGRDLSCYLREASIQISAGAMDTTVFCSSLKEYIEDFPDGRVTISGFFDDSANGAFKTLLPRFGRGVQTRVAIATNGHGVGKMYEAYSGIITSFNQTRSVADIQAMQMDNQIVGELFVMYAANHFTADQITVADFVYSVDRTDVGFTGSYYAGMADISGWLYLQVYNPTAASLDFLVNTGATAMAAEGAAGATTVTVAAGQAVGVKIGGSVGGTTLNTTLPMTINEFVGVSLAAAPSAPVQFLLGLIDPNLSLLRT